MRWCAECGKARGADMASGLCMRPEGRQLGGRGPKAGRSWRQQGDFRETLADGQSSWEGQTTGVGCPGNLEGAQEGEKHRRQEALSGRFLPDLFSQLEPHLTARLEKSRCSGATSSETTGRGARPGPMFPTTSRRYAQATHISSAAPGCSLSTPHAHSRMRSGKCSSGDQENTP